MIVVAVILALAVLVLITRTIRSERALRDMAQFLSGRDALGNTRVTISMRSHGFIQLGAAINKQLDSFSQKLRNAEKNKRNLNRGLTALSHDIRTPLAGARGYLQLLANEEDEALRARYLGVVEHRMGEVGNLLEQLYVLAQTQDPDYQLEREAVRVNAVLTETLASLYPLFRERSWNPTVQLEDESLCVFSNAEALERIFRNLFTNALRYGSEAPRIVQQNYDLAFSNRVEAPASIDTSQLFDRFYRGNVARSEEGSGLGLAIVAQLAQKLDIKVSARLHDDILCIKLRLPH